MTHRNHDWTPLGVFWDPTPGNPAQVAQEARTLRTSAESMSSAASNLRRLDAPDTCSEAITKIMTQAVATASLLEDASRRYSSTAAALSAYAPALESAQAESLAALREAGPAQATERASYKKSLGLYLQAKATIDPVEREQAVGQLQKAKAQQEQARHSLDAARARLHRAIEARDSAAQKAASAVESATTGGELNDTGWDKFVHAMERISDLTQTIGDWIWKHIDEISLVLTIAAIALAWVPGLNVVLAGLAMGARALSFAKAGHDLITGIAEGLKTGNWGNAAMGAAGLVLSVVGGKAVGVLAKKAGGLATRSVASGVTKGLGGYNAWLKKSVQARFNHLQALVIKSHKDGGTTIARATNAGRKTSYYHQAAKSIDELHSGANQASRDIASRADAVLATVKGTDYDAAIKHAVSDLAKASKHHDISAGKIAEVAGDLGEAAGEVVEEVVEDAGEALVDEAATRVDGLQRDLEHHRVSPTVCRAP